MSHPQYRPLALLAELTYKCPLHCAYCSNPFHYPTGKELDAREWRQVFKEAAALGVLHVGFSGGEPLVRPDLCELVASAVESGLYVNLITSAVGLNQQKILELSKAGLRSIQISFQAHELALANQIAGISVHNIKLQAAYWVAQSEVALSLNVVLHRANLGHLEEIVELAESLGAVRLELANVQYYGWALLNRDYLLPPEEQVQSALAVAVAAKERLAGTMDIVYVQPDYFQDRPKPCMQGWGRRYMTVNPVGRVLPCPNAFSIPDLELDSVREKTLASIWFDSISFNRFRGTEWMPDLCKLCPQRDIDHGGCRCQAALIVGNASETDPICSLSPNRHLIDEAISRSTQTSLERPPYPRTNPINPNEN